MEYNLDEYPAEQTARRQLSTNIGAALKRDLALYKWLAVGCGILVFILLILVIITFICWSYSRKAELKKDLENTGSLDTLPSESPSSGIGSEEVSVSSNEQPEETENLLKEASDKPNTEVQVATPPSDSTRETHETPCRDQRINGVNPTNEPGEHDKAYG